MKILAGRGVGHDAQGDERPCDRLGPHGGTLLDVQAANDITAPTLPPSVFCIESAKKRTIPMFGPELMAEQEGKSPVDVGAMLDGPECRRIKFCGTNFENAPAVHLVTRLDPSTTLCGRHVETGDKPPEGLKNCQTCWAEAARMRSRVVR